MPDQPCSVWAIHSGADDATAEIMRMVVEDPEGYGDTGASKVLSDLTNQKLLPRDLRDHRSRDCACGGVLIRDDSEA